MLATAIKYVPCLIHLVSFIYNLAQLFYTAMLAGVPMMMMMMVMMATIYFVIQLGPITHSPLPVA